MNKKWNHSNEEWERLFREEEKKSDKTITKVLDIFLVLVLVAILVFR